MKINTIRKLYHGTDQQFEAFDLKYAKSFKDFGKGFYLTSNLQQAQKWAQRKGWKKGTAYIYSYDVKKIAETGRRLRAYEKENKSAETDVRLTMCRNTELKKLLQKQNAVKRKSVLAVKKQNLMNVRRIERADKFKGSKE